MDTAWKLTREREWSIYELAMQRWHAEGEGVSKPRAPFQYGSHIDSLPVENNLPAAANFLIDAL